MKLPENVFVASPSDVVRFNKTQLGRAKTNLFNAQKRGDRRAVANIQRKMAIYQYTIDMAQRYIVEGEYIAKQITEAGD